MATLHTDVLASLGPRIVEGGLAGDSLITLDWLCQEYAVSRTVAREVVQVLASMGLVESRRRTGVRVLTEQHWDVFDPAVLRWWLAGARRPELLAQLSQLRASVEPLAAALAARHATDEQRAEVVALAARMEETGARGDLKAFLEHDVAFHRLLLDASGNVLFARLGDVVEEVLRGRTDHHLMPPEPKPEARRLHTMVADAVELGRPELAEAAMSAICAEVLAEMVAEAGGDG
ncbi:FadR/GntR family transcriptional regulator [Nocardioides sp.]|uniref:FadR/GntR family transcriptional regulator n=1 Tax=Nocardioides sp. TaxID=35761 RepID=UPI0027331156|nr:FCD domain-containing protein [Nocardioides sp.]MDP3892839.1 FCD domain-containing protein [Nocardioides sp.]